MKPQRIMVVIGTRPEAIKLAPIVLELRQRETEALPIVCWTRQHERLAGDILDLFGITPDVTLDPLPLDMSLAETVAWLITGLNRICGDVQPDWIVCQGDTATTLAASQVAFFRQTRLAHVEAGLRTGNFGSPFPEEFNRRVADLVPTLLFAPTERACMRLLDEGILSDQIAVTGNTGVDAVRLVTEMLVQNGNMRSAPNFAGIEPQHRVVLVTSHRRENQGRPLESICRAVRTLADQHHEAGVRFVWPVHPNPAVYDRVRRELDGSPVIVTEPMNYPLAIRLLRRAELVLTDSGGLHEDATAVGTYCMVLRDHTERTEGISIGIGELIGTNEKRIVEAVTEFLSCSITRAIKPLPCPFGDGFAAQQIVQRLIHDGLDLRAQNV